MTIWTRVRSLQTGAHFDVSLERLDHLLAIGAVVEVDPPRRHAGDAQPPKPHRRKGDGSTNRRRRPS